MRETTEQGQTGGATPIPHAVNRSALNPSGKATTMSNNNKRPDVSSTRTLSDRYAAAVEAFRDDDAMLRQSTAIDAFTGLVDSPEDVAAGISDGRARAILGSPETWTPAEDGKGPESYA